ncbi:DHH family phosphoesterase [Deinococcus yavapaiensis]|nr:DHH family phosphoesterase [Deinococcus yavapaiensis]
MTLANHAEPRYADLCREVARHLSAHTGPILIFSHVDADGDALGSSLGLARALRLLGKDATACVKVPNYLRFLASEGEVRETPLEAWPEGALTVVLDVDNNDPVRVDLADLASFSGPVLNVDHHGTNKRTATVSLVDPTKAATALMVMDVVNELGAPWSSEVATPILLGINTDTGSFKFSNTTPEVLRAAADLVEHGADLVTINEQLAQQSRSYFALLREVLGSMEFLFGGLVVIARVDEGMLARAGATWEEVESYVSVIRSARGTELACLFKDYGASVKLSVRSRGKLSAQRIAVACGGGGHFAAAGATVKAPFVQARALFDREAKAELERVGLA